MVFRHRNGFSLVSQIEGQSIQIKDSIRRILTFPVCSHLFERRLQKPDDDFTPRLTCTGEVPNG
jgi:hypothetical protein